MAEKATTKRQATEEVHLTPTINPEYLCKRMLEQNFEAVSIADGIQHVAHVSLEALCLET